MAKFLKFNGSTDAGSVAHASDLILNTVNWEFNVTFALNDITQSQRYLFTKGGNDYGIIYNYNTNKLEIYSLSDNGTLRNASSLSIADTDKHNVVYSQDAGGVFRAYLDGVLMITQTIGTTFAGNSDPLYFMNSGPYNGNLGASMYAFSIKKNGVTVLNYGFQEGSGSVVNDLTGNGHTMSLIGSPQWLTETTVQSGAASLSSVSSISASSNVSKKGVSSLSALSTLSANLERVVQVWEGTVSLSSASGMSSDAMLTKGSGASISASSVLDASGILIEATNNSAGLVASSSLSVNGIRIIKGMVTLSSQSSLDIAPIRNEINGKSSLSSSSSFLSDASVTYQADIILNGKGNMVIVNAKALTETAQLEAMRVIITELKGGIPLINNQNIEIIQGDTLNISVQLKEADGTPINLDTLTSIKWGFGTETKGIRKERDTGITITSAEEGVLTISLKPEDTLDKMERTAHELKIKDTLGAVSTVLRGVIDIQKSII